VIKDKYNKLIESISDGVLKNMMSELRDDLSKVWEEFGWNDTSPGKIKEIGSPSSVPILRWSEKLKRVVGFSFAPISLPSTSVGDTNTIDLDSTAGILTGNVIYQDTDTIDMSDDPSGLKADVKKQMSVDSDASGVKLVNDAASPGNTQYYGTNGAGTKGWFSLLSTKSGSFGVIFDGNGSVITANYSAFVTIPYAGTITGWEIFSIDNTDGTALSGSVVIDGWKDTYANFPPTVADTIWGGSKPTLSTASKNQATGLSIAVAANDGFTFHVDSATTCKYVILVIYIAKA